MDFYLQRVLRAIESATAGMDTEQLAAHPEGKWSSAEILEHLRLAFSATAKGLDRVIQAGKPAGGRPRWRNRLVNFVLLDLEYFPSGRAAPEMTVPRGADPGAVLANIRQDVARMDAALADCERRFGPRLCIANHPILGPFTVRQWRKFHWVHTRHHMKQIAALRRNTKGAAVAVP